MATVAKRLIRREIIGDSVHSMLAKRIHEKPINAIKEAINNAQASSNMAGSQGRREVKMTINVESTHDLQIEDYGTGILDYDSFTKMGHDTDSDEYKKRQADPNDSAQIGIGINSYVNLSQDGVAVFNSVTQDEQGRRSGLVATMVLDRNRGWTGFEHPPEILDSQYVLDHPGLLLIIKNVTKPNGMLYTRQEFNKYVSEHYYRKISDGWPILIKDAQIDKEFVQVRSPADICVQLEHEEEIEVLSNGSAVHIHLHPVDRLEDCKIDILIK